MANSNGSSSAEHSLALAPVEPMSKAQLEKELRDIRQLVGACLGALIGFTKEKQEPYLREAEGAEWLRRFTEDPMLEQLLDINAAGALRRHGCPESRSESGYAGGYMTLEEVALAGRDHISSIDGVGPRSMEKLDKAMNDHGYQWACPAWLTEERKEVID